MPFGFVRALAAIFAVACSADHFGPLLQSHIFTSPPYSLPTFDGISFKAYLLRYSEGGKRKRKTPWPLCIQSMHSWIQNTFIMLIFSSINNESTEIKSYFKFVIFSFTIESSNRIQASNSISPLFHLSLPESTPPPPVFAVSTTC